MNFDSYAAGFVRVGRANSLSTAMESTRFAGIDARTT